MNNFPKTFVEFIAQAENKTLLVIIFSSQFSNLHVVLTFPGDLVTIFVFSITKSNTLKLRHRGATSDNEVPTGF